MSQTEFVPVSRLSLDLHNFRTVPQESEEGAVEAIIATGSDRFWALTESLLADGYLATENIIVLKSDDRGTELTVREGNRRVAALKLILGLTEVDLSRVPSDILQQISELSQEWKTANSEVPCMVFEPSEADTVDLLVTRAHGKGQKTGRDRWNAVARARHNREYNGASEPGLDLLEKYLEHGRNATPDQKGRWSGDYPITVLDAALQKLAPRLALQSAREVAQVYPKSKYSASLEALVFDIGQGAMKFPDIRSTKEDFAKRYGLPALGETVPERREDGAQDSGQKVETALKKSVSQRPKSTGTNDYKTVRAQLKSWEPRGPGRAKLVDLKQEAYALDPRKTPLAFCFVLRSMFELSAKAYCSDHESSGGPTMKKRDGSNKPLVNALRDIVKHLTKNGADHQAERLLHGAMVELAKKDGLLSVKSMNQLIHNRSFTISSGDLFVIFGNVFPLLVAMN